MLTAGELASMRATANTALPGTAVIQTSAWASDGGGGGSTTWSAAGTVDCRLAPATAMEGIQGNRISAKADYVVTLPADASVTTNSRILTGGGTFNVEAVLDRSWDLTTRLEVSKED